VTKRGFSFTPVNVMAEPAGFEVLDKLGVKGLPVLTKGDRHVYGLDLAMVDEVLGILSDRESLPVDELLRRATTVVDAAVRIGRQLPKERVDDPLPGRPPRTYGMLPNHVVGHLRRLVLVTENPTKDWSDAEEYAQAGYQSGTEDIVEPDLTMDDVAERARDLSERALAWGARNEDTSQKVEAFYGTVPLYQIVESNTYSIVQHTLQLQAVVTFLGHEPDGLVGEAEYAGLNLPKALWDEV
jgi:hypothetical protein